MEYIKESSSQNYFVNNPSNQVRDVELRFLSSFSKTVKEKLSDTKKIVKIIDDMKTLIQ